MNLLVGIAGLLVLVGMIMYAALAGADFGGGFWTAFASGPRREEQRENLFMAIGPVWETNHVWLIFVVVVLFTCFPKGFEVLFISLLVPLVCTLVGINFRGAAFVFRHFGKYKGTRLPATEAVFSIASMLTPFFLGMAVSATGAGHIHLVNGDVQGDIWMGWIKPFTIVGGLIGVAVCAYITPFYMLVRTQGGLQEDFRKRAIAGAVALGVLTTVEIPIAWMNVPLFFEGFIRPVTLLFVGLSVAGGVSALVLLWKRKFMAAQLAADFTIATTICGFASASYPYMLLGQMSIAQAAAPAATLRAVLATLPVGAAVLVPSLIFLYRSFGGHPNPDVPL